MTNLPFEQPGRFFRGNLHTHCTRSDGVLPLADAIAAYRDHGYDFISMTDHFLPEYDWPLTDTSAFDTDSFVTIHGAELHAPRTRAGDRWHIVAVGLPPDFARCPASERGPALAARAREAGAFVGIAHPSWYGLTLADALTLSAAHSVEIYNHGCQVEVDRGESWYMADMLALAGRRLTAYAADDAHFKHRDYRGGWVNVRAERLEAEALLVALKAGHFYSSQGPEIHAVEVQPDKIRIACSPARAVIVTGPGSKSSRLVRDDGPPITEVELSLEKLAGHYCRVTVVDRAGRRAWTNPIWPT